MVNASPDLPAQIRAFPELQPHVGAVRGTPIAGIFLTNADLDHVLGLLTLREGTRLRVHATNAVRQTLDRFLGFSAILDVFCGIAWQEPTGDFAAVVGGGEESSLLCRAIGLRGGPPVFAKGNDQDGLHAVAYQFLDRKTNGRLLVAPDVGECNLALMGAMRESDAVLFDGTFWSGDELACFKAAARTAAEMGHLTIKESLPLLGDLPATRKIYIHINNTNPVLSVGSVEQTAVAAAGVVVGYDGLEFEI